MKATRSAAVLTLGVLFYFVGANAQEEVPVYVRPAPSVKVLIKLAAKALPDLRGIDGILQSRQPHWAPEYRVIEFADRSTAETGMRALRESPDVALAKLVRTAARETRAFELNDPLASFNANTPGYQWHLRNTGQNGATAGIDLNVTSAWQTVRGSGVTVAVLDDAVEISHPDIAPNAANGLHFDWLDDSPENPEGGSLDEHGTACAGLAAGRGGNELGTSGVAPEASLVGLRMLGNVVDDEVEGAALAHEAQAIHIKSSSWGPSDRNTETDGPAELAMAALEHGARNGRGGLGTLYVWAAGNGRDDGDFSNHDGYANSIYTIAVGAVADTGTITDYGELGSNVLISAPSSGGGQMITTTDLTGVSGRNSGFSAANFSDPDYRNNFGGTSAAAPQIAGALALLLETNNTLSWRDVQEILLRSARRIEPADPDWIENESGLDFHPSLGAGLLDVSAAVALASNWQSLPPQVKSSVTESALALSIPDGIESGVMVPVTFPEMDHDLRIEHVTLDVVIRHEAKGQLGIRLVSPHGTVSSLAIPHSPRGNDANRDYLWKFMSVIHWGETLAGDWQLIFSDNTAGVSGIVEEFAVTAYGSKPAAPTPTTYDVWVATHFPDMEMGLPENDPDRDGLTNLIEYAMRTDPLLRTSLDEDSRFEFRRDPLLTDIDWLPEYSRDLQAWSNADTSLVRTTDSGVEIRKLLSSEEESSGYFRLRVRLKDAP